MRRRRATKRGLRFKKKKAVRQTLLHGNLTYTYVDGTNEGEGPKKVN